MTSLTKVERNVVDVHRAQAGTDDGGFVDGQRVAQTPRLTSVFVAASGRLWVHNNTRRKQARQDLYFHATYSVASTLTCSHRLKFWDIERHATTRELLRIQGFPETFTIPHGNAVRLTGNAVAVPCARHACECVVRAGECVTHVDLCAGIGGFSCALRDATDGGCACVGYSEIDSGACRVYEANFPNVDALGDARAVRAWPRADVLTAGFPCQPFSTSRTSAETHPSIDFYRTVLHAIAETRASAIVLENVPSIVTAGRGRWTDLLDGLRSMEFDVQHAVLDARAHGVPQARRRLYLVGVRGGRPMRPLIAPSVPAQCPILRDILEHSKKKEDVRVQQ